VKQFKAAKAELEAAEAIICDGYQKMRVRPTPKPSNKPGENPDVQ
jgi:hypothetical protein